MKGGRIKLKTLEWQEITKQLEEMVKTIKFGSITLIIQDGKMIQIEKNEKIRLQTKKHAD